MSTMDEFAYAQTSIWWDIENCSIPKDFKNYAGLLGNIKAALKLANCFGEVSISAYGNMKLVDSKVGETLARSGVKMNHVFSRGKDSADKTIVVEMLLWALEHKPPANILLISGDADFAAILNRLSSKLYNIMVAHQNQQVQFHTLVSSAACTWSFRDLIEGRSPMPMTNCGRIQKLVFQDIRSSHLIGKLLSQKKDDIDLLTPVLGALSFFKSDLIAPTKLNLFNYFFYKYPHVNLDEALTCALERNVIVKQIKDKMEFYIRLEDLWEFNVNIEIYGRPTWEKIRKFMKSPLASKLVDEGKSNYEVGIALRRSDLSMRALALGEILTTLKLQITTKSSMDNFEALQELRGDDGDSDEGETSESDWDSDTSEREREGITAEELYDKVKKEKVPLVKSIFEKYGDIFARRKNCTLEEDLVDWEYVCTIYETLEEKEEKIELEELQKFRFTMHYWDSVDVKIGWLKIRIDAILKIKELAEACSSFSKAKKRVSIAIEKNTKDIETNKKKLAEGMNALEVLQWRSHPRIKECRERIEILEEKGALLAEVMHLFDKDYSILDGLI